MPISTLEKTTPKKSPMQATKSNLSNLPYIRTAASISIRPTIANIMIADITALGVYLNSGVIRTRVRSTTQDITMLETAVLQPAKTFTAVREKGPANKSKEQMIKI